jgi:hypothetical protein
MLNRKEMDDGGTEGGSASTASDAVCHLHTPALLLYGVCHEDRLLRPLSYAKLVNFPI